MFFILFTLFKFALHLYTENPDHAGSRAQRTTKKDPEYELLPTDHSKEADNGRTFQTRSKQSEVETCDRYQKKEKNISSGFVNEQENGPSGKEEKDISPYSSHNPLRSDHTRDTNNQAKCGRMKNYQR